MPLQRHAIREVTPGEVGPFEMDAREVSEVLEGLAESQARVSPKYLYDPLGSRLFEAITDLPEYYPTRTEGAIFQAHIGSIVRAVGEQGTLIELGAGNGEKAAALFDAFLPAQYVAIDISAVFLEGAVKALKRAHPALSIVGAPSDITAGLRLPSSVKAHRRLFMYLGSSIGNFDPEDALRILKDVRRHCDSEGGLLIGVDLVKDVSILEAAYYDGLGVTAAFNLNLLNHLNGLVGTNFNLRDWRHRARFNASRSRVEMHLEARRDVLVAWPGGSRRFEEGETIHTENSYKYRLEDFRRLIERAGFGDVKAWTDDRNWFGVFHARAVGPR